MTGEQPSLCQSLECIPDNFRGVSRGILSSDYLRQLRGRSLPVATPPNEAGDRVQTVRLVRSKIVHDRFFGQCFNVQPGLPRFGKHLFGHDQLRIAQRQDGMQQFSRYAGRPDQQSIVTIARQRASGRGFPANSDHPPLQTSTLSPGAGAAISANPAARSAAAKAVLAGSSACTRRTRCTWPASGFKNSSSSP